LQGIYTYLIASVSMFGLLTGSLLAAYLNKYTRKSKYQITKQLLKIQ
jgi:hypothetical protein